MMRFFGAALLALLVATTAARADSLAASQCAAALPPNSKLLYDKSLPAVLGGTSIRDALTASARALVLGGSMSRNDARPAAQTAAPCLEKLR
ncbi:MAG TPA: hypothetical protein VMB84_06500 [Stellaceae bacterium]|nr:hypothetical protein [Stellaceae bacterium]